MFQKRNILFLILFCAFQLNAQTNIKTMFYNTLNYNSNTESQNRTPYLKTILEDIRPDLLMVCELKNEIASNYLFNNAVLTHNSNFDKATFRYSESPATGLLQMVYYNKQKLNLTSEAIIPTETRDINHYTFVLNTENFETKPIKLEVFVTHLKASKGSDNRSKRLASTEIFKRELDRLPADSFVVFAGDFNFYTINEPGFQEIIDSSNSIKIIDPINRLCPTFPDNEIDYFNDDFYNSTYFWNNSSFADVHSQSTRSSQVNGDGAGGGMDDRFDFIMLSENFTTSSDLYYINNSYKTIGNNGNYYNSYVSNSSCSGDFSQETRNALYDFSDHLPIVLEMETPEKTLSIAKNNNAISFLKSNIVKRYITLKMNEKVNSLIIYNHLGQSVLETTNINNDVFTIDINILSKGMYYLKADNNSALKFVKF